jgi:tyrosyl-tRNA synthetase
MFGITKQKVITDEKIVDELLSRGVEAVFPSKDFLKSKMIKGETLTLYLGVDPTGKTLHLGHVIPLKKLGEFQKLGHKIIFLIGDFTAMIGDPSDKTATRKKQTREEVLENCKEYKKQASRFISFSGSNPAILRFNSEWLNKMKFGDVLELASHMTVDQMLKRDMFARRSEENKPIYIHEFMYPLMQGYDSIAMNVDGEIGGNDQTFNMLAGRHLMKTIQDKEKFVIATKLLTDSAGKKMGKTEGNMVALDQSPEEIFGKVMSWTDNLIVPGFEIITDISREEIETIKKDLEKPETNPKEYKVRLAKEIVTMCHDKQAADKAEENFTNTFSKKEVPEDVLEIEVEKGVEIRDILIAHNVVSSNSDWRRLIDGKAVSYVGTEEIISDPHIKAGESTVMRIGKKRFVKFNVKVK